MGRQAPGRVRLEHVVLEDEVARVGPVVGDLALVVVAHHVERQVRDAVLGIERVLAALAGADETVHLPVVVVGLERDRARAGPP